MLSRTEDTYLSTKGYKTAKEEGRKRERERERE